MKKIVFASTALLTLLAMTLCKAAAGQEESFYRQLRIFLPNNWQQAEVS